MCLWKIFRYSNFIIFSDSYDNSRWRENWKQVYLNWKKVKTTLQEWLISQKEVFSRRLHAFSNTVICYLLSYELCQMVIRSRFFPVACRQWGVHLSIGIAFFLTVTALCCHRLIILWTSKIIVTNIVINFNTFWKFIQNFGFEFIFTTYFKNNK